MTVCDDEMLKDLLSLRQAKDLEVPNDWSRAGVKRWLRKFELADSPSEDDDDASFIKAVVQQNTQEESTASSSSSFCLSVEMKKSDINGNNEGHG